MGRINSGFDHCLLSGLVLLLCFGGSLSLLCYQCAFSGANSLCETDYWGFVNASKSDGQDDPQNYVKNCTAAKTDWKYCMIEKQESDKKIKLYHRGCTSGITLTFDDQRFHNLNPTNETTCSYVKDSLVCYSLCDTDLCNGPQIPPQKNNTCIQNPDDIDDLCGAPSIHTSLFVFLMTTLSSLTYHFLAL